MTAGGPAENRLKGPGSWGTGLLPQEAGLFPKSPRLPRAPAPQPRLTNAPPVPPWGSSINPVTGRVEEKLPNPMEGMTEEQKEHEAMKLVNMFDKLSRCEARPVS